MGQYRWIKGTFTESSNFVDTCVVVDVDNGGSGSAVDANDETSSGLFFGKYNGDDIVVVVPAAVAAAALAVEITGFAVLDTDVITLPFTALLLILLLLLLPLLLDLLVIHVVGVVVIEELAVAVVTVLNIAVGVASITFVS